MEFAMICPNDGRVELGLEDVTAVVFHGTESVEVVFTCPTCGTSLRAMLLTPNLLAAAAMEVVRQVREGEGGPGSPDSSPRWAKHQASDHAGGAVHDDERDTRLRQERERAGEPYCEYFRRQLAEVECVEDLLSELD